MRFAVSSLAMAAFMVAGAFSAQAAEVLMIAWQGKSYSEKAFEKHLKTLHPDVSFKYILPERNKSKLAEELRSADLSKTDVVYSFGTTGTKIVKQFLKHKKPMVFNFVSAPVLSNIADSIEKPGKNITGARFLVDLKTQLEVMASLKKVKKLAVWFDPREKQNAVILKKMKKEAGKLGMDINAFRIIPDSSNFQTFVSEASAETNKMDALYIIASSSFDYKLKEIHAKLDPRLLVMATYDAYVAFGSTVALGADIIERAKAGAELVAKVLKGTPAGNIPINMVTAEKANLYVNKDRMAAVGLKGLDKLGYNVKLLDPKKYLEAFNK